MKIKLLLMTLLFGLSGTAALIYEAVWARYLKLLLGHSSYGQILTLCIFMGGIGAGSFFTGKWVKKISQPLLIYSLIEGVIGILGFLYHTCYVALSAWLMDSGFLVGMPGWSVVALKWFVGAGITFPSAFLMGMTFPLMVTAFIRLHPKVATESISKLYFVNAIGGVLGVLLTSYVLINVMGTVGALMFAGTLNLVIACILYLVARSESTPSIIPEQSIYNEVSSQNSEFKNQGWIGILLLISALTGLSSFFYEIGWIRLLSLVLGSSTHSFDLMISAFILGLALGSLYIYRSQGKKDTILSLAWIQILMGLSACFTLYSYSFYFAAINHLNQILTRTNEAYFFYSFAKWMISVFMMCPTSFFAGMTLPLITSTLFRETRKESYAGHVYGWNTIGSIAGAAIGGLVLMPVLQLEKTIATGAAIDFALGLFLLIKRRSILVKHAPILIGSFALVIGAFLIHFNGPLISAGVFRGFVPLNAIHNRVVQIIHGKTATISVEIWPNRLTIQSNGKTDASLYHNGESLIGGDNLTQSGLAYYAMGTQAKPYSTAIIGLGSGMTAHYLMGDNFLEHLDLIEIEPAVYKLAKNFRPYNDRIYSDPRIKIHFEDARTFFSTKSKKYDVIISEPSNPWVSGVSSLFTIEFFRMAKQHLQPDGVLVQWMHLYELNDPILASILVAISKVFPNFEIYTIADHFPDIAIVINNKPAHFPGLERMSKNLAIKGDFSRLGIPTNYYSSRQFIASRKSLEPLLKSFNPNSDYFPIVDNFSEKTFFTKENASLPKILSSYPMGYSSLVEGPEYKAIWDEKRRYAFEKIMPQPWKVMAIKNAIENSEIPSSEIQSMIMNLVPLELWGELEKKSTLISDALHRSTDTASDDIGRLIMKLYLYQSKCDTALAVKTLKNLMHFPQTIPLKPEVTKQMFLTAVWAGDDSLAIEVYGKFFSNYSKRIPLEDIMAKALIRAK